MNGADYSSECNAARLFTVHNENIQCLRTDTKKFRRKRGHKFFPQKQLYEMMPTTQADSERRRYRAAIALNNIAVTLLHHGYYSDCISTLKDALNIMRRGTIDVGQALRHAQIALSQKSFHAHLCDAYPRILVVSSQANPMNVGECLLLEKDEKYRSLYAITIDLAYFEDGGSPDVEAFTILYNYGIAYLCLAHYCGEDHLFRNAQSIFQKVQNWMWIRVHKEDSNVGIFTVYLLVMRNLEQSSARFGSHLVATQYQQTIQQWVDYLRLQERPLLALPCGAAAA